MPLSKLEFVNALTQQLATLQMCAKQNDSQKIKLIIHAGTPKTGTTSIQTYLAKKQRKLRGRGILYPHNLDKLQHSTAPKHQWFEKNLLTTNLDSLLENLKNVISQIKQDTHTVILSSEGIYNYWWDIPDASQDILREMAVLFDIQVWVWFRDPLTFIESYYKQCIRNPEVHHNPCYGKDLSFSQMMELKWFYQHLDYRGFVHQCEGIFGKKHVSVFAFEGDVVQQVSQRLGLATEHDNPTPRQNNSLHNTSIELLRVINRLGLKAKDKTRVMDGLHQIDKVLENYSSDTVIDEASKHEILRRYKPI